ncbi:hypothetical protein [Polluticoccus soli]|uniref:hypothetical protein n=1 Tax=Polluticoccus soli TaxID=3034150 RepID=UPI0023E21842|nr:hypothetical protein [Flavipsychrobacter sp. JY13-12]
MKKLTLALLLALSTSVFAQKNELALSPGALYYKGFTSSFSKSNYIGNLEGGGFR